MKPCKNPACKSVGKIHPNCRCWGDMAEGGEVKPYCASNNPHKAGCEYYRSSNGAELHGMNAHDAVASYLTHGHHSLLEMKKHHPDHAMKKYDRAIKAGGKKFDSHIEEVFGGPSAGNEDLKSATESLDEWISKGGHTDDLQEELYKQNAPENLAEGGEVKKHHKGIHGHPIEQEYPEQNIMLNTAKGRASIYLQSLKPQKHQPKLAFDDEPNSKQQEKSYKRALNLAAHPLSILQKIKKGTIEPEHIAHLNALHPEINEALQNRLTEKITQMQMKGEKPNYKVRQGLSMLLGAPLSGEMTPANIQAAQASFRAQGGPSQQSAGATPTKRASAVSKSSQAYLLPEDAAASRQQKQ